MHHKISPNDLRRNQLRTLIVAGKTLSQMKKENRKNFGRRETDFLKM